MTDFKESGKYTDKYLWANKQIKMTLEETWIIWETDKDFKNSKLQEQDSTKKKREKKKEQSENKKEY